ncbi:MAG: L,D-transpeptidase [Bacillota bacterium]
MGIILSWLAASPLCFGDNPWLIRINIPEFKLLLYRSETLFEKFNVAVGRPDSPSPLGDYWIANKVVNPTWYPPDKKTPVPPGPDNPLGQYWMGLNIEGYGIHGNSAAWSIGNPVSLGCFRLHNSDIRRLFTLVPVGTPVKITYETVRSWLDGNNRAWLEVFPDIYHWQNQENEVINSISGLGWAYQPHWKALQELLQRKKPLKVEIPRVIAIEGESLAVDGFYWEHDVYLAKDVQKILPVNTKPSLSPFINYLKIDLANNETKDLYYWDEEANTLRIYRLKVLLNGMELTGAVRRLEDGKIGVNLELVALGLGADFCWDLASENAVCRGTTISGEPSGGIFWVEPEALSRIWPAMVIQWDEKTGLLELNCR